MEWTPLPTNYTDAVWSGLRKYVMVENEDNTVSFQDVTQYSQRENSFFGALDANSMNAGMNQLVNIFNGLLYNNAGAHNSIYRGKNLGTSVSNAQWEAISSGDFTDLYIGDYWEIDNRTWRIAAFDYYLTTGDTACNTHHVVIVPDTKFFDGEMNNTSTTTGGYANSKMFTSLREQVIDSIEASFGANHILSHRKFLCTGVTNGKPSGGAWFDSKVELMTEQNMYGGRIYGVGNDGSTVPSLFTLDKSQFPLFALNPYMISNRQSFWLRDITSATDFVYVSAYGTVSHSGASDNRGVRPSFCIK